jgi:ATP-dependent DNA helicase DinG
MEEIFGPSGSIAKYHPQYEFRPGQVEMAKAVLQVMQAGGCLLSEAGTGTGKTLAYLIPALALGKRVIVSTATKNLQEQLYYKDIPFLEQVLARKLRVAYLKGRSNYVCLNRLRHAEESPILRGFEEMDYFDSIRRWAITSQIGDRAELTHLPDNIGFWPAIDARSEACIGQRCPDFDECFITRARQRAQEADVIIVNHHLFFADLSLKNNEYGSILPEYAAVIFDEAHELEEIAAEYFGTQVNSHRLQDLHRDLAALSFVDPHDATAVAKMLARLGENATTFWTHFYQLAKTEGRHRLNPNFWKELTADGSVEFTDLGESYIGLDILLGRIAATLRDTKDATIEFGQLARRIDEFQQDLSTIMQVADESWVYWFEYRGKNVFLQATPIDIAGLLQQKLFSHPEAVVLTSATLTAGGSFEFIRQRLGIVEAQEISIESPFDYTRQTLLYLPPRMPDPRAPDFTAAAIKEIVQILHLTQGRAFVLFTSVSQMQQVYNQVQLQIPFPALIQGQGSKTGLLNQFRRTPNAVLFAVASFWQGVDIQGEALSCVIIDKIPFAVPSDPVIAARQNYIDDQGGSSFNDYFVPQAAIALKQGLGRLIRSRSDCGVLSILDPRLRTKSYGRFFFESLPPCPITTRREDILQILK